ncbi:SLC13 family permease [Microbacterium sp. Marseille-Q6648]|uniref:GntP family permease n=1 Tax=Microbacterium sp. Marseille-Q6648 TaxID=2937991 RepID=UPI00203FA9E6|nr:SLC13 family permease [Microbacterium sp. Marseille-Q6648]
MSTAWVIVLFVAVFVGIALLIVRLRINPAIALLVGTVVLGVASGMSLDDVVTGVNEGFGALMAEVGLLISLGVIMGTLMSSYGAVQRIVGGIVGLFGRRASPYAFSLTLSTLTPSIYFDVLLVLVAPIARTVANRTGRPVASLAGPVAMGLAAGNALVLPGAALLAYLGAMRISVSEMLIPGFVVAIPAVLLTTFLYLLLIERLRWWKPALDEDVRDEAVPDPADDAPSPRLGMLTALAPVLVVLVLIISSIVIPLFGVEVPVIDFLGSPVIALLLGTLTALVITVLKRGLAAQEVEVGRALETVGTILVVTAVAGSLGAIIAGTGIQDVLSGLLGANAVLPLVTVWVIAAILRMAIGGQTVAGITAIGIMAPLMGELGVSPILVVLAAGAGSCFGGQFSDNAFWMLRSLFGLSTRGTLKTYTLAQSMLSIVVLVFVLIADIFV